MLAARIVEMPARTGIRTMLGIVADEVHPGGAISVSVVTRPTTTPIVQNIITKIELQT